eukprot:COSAG05_NODE_116_length_17986_cov_348.987534_16_plen_78_part_00
MNHASCAHIQTSRITIRYAQVLQNLQQVSEAVLGPWHANTAYALAELAEVHEESGDFNASIGCLDRVVLIFQTVRCI